MPSAHLTPAQVTLFRRRLLRWFDKHRRDLPWRHDRDPYRIWVSEVMLQQTTVAMATNRFVKFLNIFPSLEQLAKASEQQVLRAWEGLGYYRRARDLHRAARILFDSHGERLPDDPAIWKQLPGVGRYILGAVLSQAFDRRLPIVEANSQRVLCRLYAERGEPTTGPIKTWLWQTASSLLPRKRAGDFNQALMELGALVCTATVPRCELCPVQSLCAAQQLGLQNVIPAKAAAPAIEQVIEVALVLRRGTQVLLVQRRPTGRWANMWEFPHTPLQRDETHADAAQRLADQLGLEAKFGAEVMTIRHAVTRFRIAMTCIEAFYQSGDCAHDDYVESRWLELQELNDYPVSTPQRKLVAELASRVRQLRLF